MMDPVRISPKEAKEKMGSGTALLVCAYADEEKFKKNRLQGAISADEFKKKLVSLSKDAEIIFYCA